MNNMYDRIPSVCFMGMQAMEHKTEEAAVEYAVDMLDLKEGVEELGGGSSPIRRQTILAVHNRVVKEVTQAAFSWPLNLAVLVAVLAQLLVGYNIGVMNAPEKVVFPGHSTASWSLAVAAFAAGGPFGANLSGKVADQKGRRTSILASATLFLAGGLIQSLATSMNIIVLARLVIGFASGFTSVVIPIYLGELAPPSLRGTLVSSTNWSCLAFATRSNDNFSGHRHAVRHRYGYSRQQPARISIGDTRFVEGLVRGQRDHCRSHLGAQSLAVGEPALAAPARL